MSESRFAPVLAGDLSRATARFDLRQLTPGDGEALFRLWDDPDVVEFMDIEQPADVAAVQRIIAWSMGARAAGNGYRWGIFDRATAAMVGTCGLHLLEGERGARGEIGYDVGRRYWGQRVMDEVVPATLAFGFGDLGLRRIEAFVTSGNAPSCRLLERHGFALEGTLRDYAYWKGQFWDQLMYARLASDP
jgi:[ribosomal protein S5]-alanine N-acetyltransferase